MRLLCVNAAANATAGIPHRETDRTPMQLETFHEPIKVLRGIGGQD